MNKNEKLVALNGKKDQRIKGSNQKTILEKKELSYNNVINLFGRTCNKINGKKDVDKINEMLYNESNKEYNEFLAIALEHKEIVKHDYCESVIHYLRALKFISYINIGYSIKDAYIKSHSNSCDMIRNTIKKKSDNGETIQQKAMLFAKSKLVVSLQQVLDYPIHIHFGGYKYSAIEVLNKEMREAPLAKDRIQAADRLLHHLTPINLQQNNLIINTSTKDEKNIVDIYKEALEKIVAEKKEVIKNNNDIVEDIINVNIIERDDEYE